MSLHCPRLLDHLPPEARRVLCGLFSFGSQEARLGLGQGCVAVVAIEVD